MSFLLRRFLSLFFRRLNQRGAGNLVSPFSLHETHALRTSSCLPNLTGLDANELALLRDNHDLRFVFHRENSHNLSSLLGCFHVYYALATAGLETIGSNGGLFAVSLLRNRKHAFSVVGRDGT